jgi:hypothetical protein
MTQDLFKTPLSEGKRAYMYEENTPTTSEVEVVHSAELQILYKCAGK